MTAAEVQARFGPALARRGYGRYPWMNRTLVSDDDMRAIAAIYKTQKRLGWRDAGFAYSAAFAPALTVLQRIHVWRLVWRLRSHLNRRADGRELVALAVRYGAAEPDTWTDEIGVIRSLPPPSEKLVFKGVHAPLRAFVVRRDGFRCVGCNAPVIGAPEPYSGRETLFVDRPHPRHGRLFLVMDHKWCREAGGHHHPDNLQSLCETCNSSKSSAFDRAAALRLRDLVSYHALEACA